jgi:hypothetical protein
VLDYDSSTYQMFHRMTVEWPCLSFDFFRDGLGDTRQRFPMTVYAVAGTQVDPSVEGSYNSLIVAKLSRLHKTQNDSDDEASSDSDDEDGDAVLEHRTIRHQGGVNRVRSQPQTPHVVASWSDHAQVNIYDVSKHLAILDGPPKLGQQAPTDSLAPLQTYGGQTFTCLRVHAGCHVTCTPSVVNIQAVLTFLKFRPGRSLNGGVCTRLVPSCCWSLGERRLRGGCAFVLSV